MQETVETVNREYIVWENGKMTERKKTSLVNKTNTQLNRREFIAGTGAAALSFTVMKPELVRGAAANSKIKLGLIGCGHRGVWLTNLLQKHGGYEIASVADYFQDRVDKCGDRCKVPPSRRYTGLSGYKKLLEDKLDAVAVITPPYFRPEQAAAAVEAGCHVYAAKPVAVDVPGSYSIAASAKKAAAKKLCFIVDFQTRADKFYCEAVKRVHNGAIGTIAFGESTYHCNRLSSDVKPGDSEPEARLRNWVFDKKLSGDIITEQNIHTLDVASWIMNKPPLYAFGTGGRKVRVDVGDCWDHFALLFQYADNVGITFTSRQFNGHDTKPDGIRNRMFGDKGVLEAQYGGQVIIRGKNFYRGGKSPAIYKDSVIINLAMFHKDITESRYDNSTVAPSVRSNLVTILGRTAAYQKRLVSWEEIVHSKETYVADLKGLKA